MRSPPPSPVPAHDGWQRPSPALRLLRRLQLGGLALVAAVALVAAAALAGAGRRSPPPALVGLLLLGLALRTADRQVAAWGYAERGSDFLVRRGVLVRRLSVVPYGRMQFVDVTAGPLDRRLGIATVYLHTAAAASDARIPGLPTDEAHRLRDRLAALGEARAAGPVSAGRPPGRQAHARAAGSGCTR